MARAEAAEGGVYAYQSEHASFQIVTPTATVRLSHGKLHQIATRDPTDQYDIPDHLTWQMNMAVDQNEVCVVGNNHHQQVPFVNAVAESKVVACVARDSCEGMNHCWTSEGSQEASTCRSVTRLQRPST